MESNFKVHGIFGDSDAGEYVCVWENESVCEFRILELKKYTLDPKADIYQIMEQLIWEDIFDPKGPRTADSRNLSRNTRI